MWLIAIVSATPVQAQPAYRCTAPTGYAYTLDRPCPSATSKFQQYGSGSDNTAQRTPATQLPRLGDVQPHHQYLPSAACKDLSEALRTGAARGVGAEGMRNLHKEWDQRCRDEENQAWQAYHERQRLDREKKVTATGSGSSASEQQAEQERCAELKRILARRRERTDLTPGEKSDLKNFEQSYQSRCGQPN